MKSISTLIKKTCSVVLLCSLMLTGIGTFALDKAAAATGDAYVYYVSDSDLYRVKSDGTGAQRLLKSFNFEGTEMKPAGDYLYFAYGEGSTTLLRVPVDGSTDIPKRFFDDAIYFETDHNFLYYMDSKGKIYRAPANAVDKSEAKLIADMADTKFSGFVVVEGRIYYNALKDGRKTWVASKAADGTGQVQWIAAGAFEDASNARVTGSTLYIVVNIKPEEVQYSTNSIVFYAIPAKGGAAKAINAKAPVDVNAAYSGWQTNHLFLINKGIKLDADGDYNYSIGKGTLLTAEGKTIDLYKTSVPEVASVGTDKLAFVDASGHAYVSTLKNNKVVSTKTLPVTDAWYVRNLVTDNQVSATLIFADSGAYVLKNDLSLQKVVGVEWDYVKYKDNVSGFFYINAGDNGRLYHMANDGKTSTKLSEETIDRIVLIDKQ